MTITTPTTVHPDVANVAVLSILVAWVERVISMDAACQALGMNRNELIELEHAVIAVGLEMVKARVVRDDA